MASGYGSYGGWAASGELDVIEMANDMTEVRLLFSMLSVLHLLSVLWPIHPAATTRGCLQAGDRAAAWSTSLRCTSPLPCRLWAAFTLAALGLQTYSAADGRLCRQGPRAAGMCTQWSGVLTRSAPHARELVQLALEACGGAVLPACLPQSSMH